MLDLHGAVSRWEAAIRSLDAARITRTYAPRALLLATMEPIPIQGRRGIRRYFDGLVDKPGFGVRFHTREVVEANVVAGLYSFVWEGKVVPARYTFVVCPQGLIDHHHSSTVP